MPPLGTMIPKPMSTSNNPSAITREVYACRRMPTDEQPR